MGKGDQKSRRGKIHIGSYGTRRPRKKSNYVPGALAPKVKPIIEKPVAVVPKVKETVEKPAPVTPKVKEIIEKPAEVEVKKIGKITESSVPVAETNEEVKKPKRKTVAKPKEDKIPE